MALLIEHNLSKEKVTFWKQGNGIIKSMKPFEREVNISESGARVTFKKINILKEKITF